MSWPQHTPAESYWKHLMVLVTAIIAPMHPAHTIPGIVLHTLDLQSHLFLTMALQGRYCYYSYLIKRWRNGANRIYLPKFTKVQLPFLKIDTFDHKFIMKLKSISRWGSELSNENSNVIGSVNTDPRLFKRGRRKWCLGRENGGLLMSLLRYLSWMRMTGYGKQALQAMNGVKFRVHAWRGELFGVVGEEVNMSKWW